MFAITTLQKKKSLIKVRRSEERGRLKLNWLHARYSFSFANYYNPEYSGFRDLLVLNHDVVSPSGGFSTHPHNDMEIVTFVIRGSLTHKDSLGNSAQIQAGEVQRMSAGTGVTHSEFNSSSSEELELLQIWILPNQLDLNPSYEQKFIREFKSEGALKLLVSPNGERGSLKINQDVKFFQVTLRPQEKYSQSLNKERGYWLQLIAGEFTVNNQALKAGDGCQIEKEDHIFCESNQGAEFLLLDLR